MFVHFFSFGFIKFGYVVFLKLPSECCNKKSVWKSFGCWFCWCHNGNVCAVCHRHRQDDHVGEVRWAAATSPLPVCGFQQVSGQWGTTALPQQCGLQDCPLIGLQRHWEKVRTYDSPQVLSVIGSVHKLGWSVESCSCENMFLNLVNLGWMKKLYRLLTLCKNIQKRLAECSNKGQRRLTVYQSLTAVKWHHSFCVWTAHTELNSRFLPGLGLKS